MALKHPTQSHRLCADWFVDTQRPPERAYWGARN
jgi:hypothetical protein